MPRIFLLLNDRSVAARLRLVIESTTGLRIVGTAETLAQAREALPGARADLVLADLEFPDGSLARLVAELHAPDVPQRPKLLAVTLTLDDPQLLEVLCLGGDGYFVLGGSHEALVQAVHSTLEGAAEMAPPIARRIKAHFEALAQDLRAATTGHPPQATPGERQLLQSLAAGFLPHEIARELHITPGEVGQQVRTLYGKLQVDPTTALRLARG